MTCPFCYRGVVPKEGGGTCSHCNTYIPKHPCSESAVRRGQHWRRPQDQDRVNPYTDYVRTREDKQ